MNVSLTPELELFIQRLVDEGGYRSASEVVRAALRLLEERQQERATKLEALRASIAEGAEELDRGEGVPAEQVFAEILEALRTSDAA